MVDFSAPEKRKFTLTIKANFMNRENNTLQYISGDINGKILNKQPIKLTDEIKKKQKII